MRSLLYTCLIAVAVAACTTETPKNYVTISGTIINPTSDSLIIDFEHTNDWIPSKNSKRISVNEGGTFEDTLKLKVISNNYPLYYGGKYLTGLYLRDGYDLKIRFDSNSFNETVTYDGTGAEPNSYLAKVGPAQSDFLYQLEGLSTDDFQKKLSTLIGKMSSDLSNIKDEDSIFVNQQKQSMKRVEINGIVHYMREIFWSNSTLADLDVEKSDFIAKVEAYILAFTDSLKADEGNTDALAFKIDEEVRNEVKQSLIHDFKNETSMSYRKWIAEMRGIVAETKGTPSPIFTDYVNFDGGTTSLHDFNDKYVYIDVWATWCGPCKREIPYLKVVEEEYRDKNIAFVGISVDRQKDFDKWKTMVKNKALSGTQLFAPNERKSPFMQAYKVKYIPRFILIDPEGNIVSANAPRPSSDELKTLLGSLNI